MASRFKRLVPVTVNDVLDGHAGLDLECLDRLYLHGYLGQLQVGGQVIQFLGHRGYPVPSPACLQQIGDAFRRRVASLAEANHIPVVTLKAADRNIEVMRPYLEAAAASGRSQVAAMGWTRKPSGCSSPASVTPLPANARNSPSTRQPAQWRPRRGWRGRRSMWRRRHCPVGVGGVGASDAVAEVPLDPRQRGVPYPVHADLRRPRPWRMPADAGPEMVIAAAADPPPIGMPEQLPVAH